MTNESAAQISAGTGFLVSRQGHVITSFHVVDGANKILFRITSGELLPATLVASDRTNDLAILKLSGEFTPLPIVSSAAIKPGTSVFTIGFPNLSIQGSEPKVTNGIISSITGIRDDITRFQITVPVQPGNSGGPLLTIEGNVIGIIAAKLDATIALNQTGALPENVGYAVKSTYANALLESQSIPTGSLRAPNRARKRDLSEIVSEAQKSIGLVIVDSNHLARWREREEHAKKVSIERAQQARAQREEQINLIKYRISLLDRNRDILVNEYKQLQRNPPRYPNNPFAENYYQAAWREQLQAIGQKIVEIDSARTNEIQKLESLYGK